MKFVYVLISDESDYYTEEVLVSMLSLKKHTPSANIVLVTDSTTMVSLGKRDSLVIKTVNDIYIADVPENFNKKCRSRYLKTSLPDYLNYDFLYIDSDTVINGNLFDVEKYDFEIGAVFDRHDNGESNTYMKNSLINSNIEDIDKLVFYNGGVIFARNTSNTKRFFKDWHSLWLKFHETSEMENDQISLLKANQMHNNIIQPLPGIYNCQLPFQNSTKYLIKAKILHYLADYKERLCYPLEDKTFLAKIRNNGIIPQVEEILENPIEIYLKDKYILTAKEKKLDESHVVILGKELSRYYPWINKLALGCLKFWAFLRLIKRK